MISNNDQNDTIKVLIVDVHPIFRIGVRRALHGDPRIRVVGEVDSAKNAVTAAIDLKPDVILMDIDLPDGNGIDAVTRIRSTQNSARIVMFTSDDRDEYILRALAAGAHGYCLKGAEPELLQLAISSVYSGAMWFDSTIAKKVAKQFCRIEATTAISQFPSDFSSGAGLSDRERDVLELLAAGLSNQEVAMRLQISVATVKTHVRKILKRLGVTDRTQAAIKAVRMRIVSD